MEYLPADPLLEFNPDTLTSVRKLHGLDEPGHMKKAVDELEEWVKNQDHFMKKDFSRHYLETTIISCKGSLDKAKTRINRVCTYRVEMPNFFGNFDVKNDFKEFEGNNYQAFLPKLTNEHRRVFITRNIGRKFQYNLVLQFVRIGIMMFDYMKCHDYDNGFIFIIDLSQISLMQMLPKLNLRELRHAAKIIIDAYGVRLKGIHLVSPSRIVNLLTWMIKQVVSMKIASRIQVHNSTKSLSDFVPLEILPVEYGGNERSLESLHDDWMNMMASDEFRSYMMEMKNARIKETTKEATNHSTHGKVKNVNKQ